MEKMLEQMTKIGKEIDRRLDAIIEADGRALQNDWEAIKKEYSDDGFLKLTYTLTYDRAREITREIYDRYGNRVYLSKNNQIQEFHGEGNWLGSFDGLYGRTMHGGQRDMGWTSML